MSRSYRINLNVLALVALFTGGLLVFSTQALSMLRRRAQFALLRMLGITRRRLALLMCAEGALIGVAGSAIGVAAATRSHSQRSASSVRTSGPAISAASSPRSTSSRGARLMFFALGVWPRRRRQPRAGVEAARASPARALKAGDEETAPIAAIAGAPGLAVMALAAATAVPPVDGVPLFGYAAIAWLLIGTLMLMPVLAGAALARMRPPANAPAALAIAQLRSAPGQVSVSLAAIVASVSLTVSMVIMVDLVRESLEAWLEQHPARRVYVRAAGRRNRLHAGRSGDNPAMPGVRRAEFLREEQLLLDRQRGRASCCRRDR